MKINRIPVNRANTLQAKQVLPNYRWNLFFLRKPKFLDWLGFELLNLHCETVNLPSVTIETGEIAINNIKFKQAIKKSIERTTNMVFVETEDLYVTKLFHIWTSGIIDNQSKSSLNKSIYTADFYLERYNNAGVIIHKCIYLNTFPESIEQGELGNDGEAQRINVTLSYDTYKDVFVPTKKV